MARNVTPYRGGGLLGGGLDPLFSLHRDMNRLFEDVLGTGLPFGGPDQQNRLINAQLSVSETEGEIRVAAELPGVREEDIDVSLDDDVLTIRGEKKMQRQDEKENFHVVERSFGSFQRSIRLPTPVDPDRVSASFDNGVLTVTLPKSAQQERTRRIQVSRGNGGSQGGRMIEGGDQQRQGGAQSGDRQQQSGGAGRDRQQGQPQGGDQQQGSDKGEPGRKGGSKA